MNVNEQQLSFLLKKLETICDNESFLSKNNKYYNDSFRSVNSYYTVKFYEKISNNRDPRTYSSLPRTLTSVSIYSLFAKTRKQSNNKYINYISFFILYVDGKLEESILSDINSYVNNAWAKFKEVYRNELNPDEATSYLFYFWRDENISILEIEFTLDSLKKKWGDCSRLNFYEYSNEEETYKKLPSILSGSLVKESLPAIESNSILLNITYDNTKQMQLVISTGSDLLTRKLFFGSYSGINNAGSLALGIGLLIKEVDAKKKLAEIIDAQKVDDIIFNFLFERRLSIQGSILNTINSVDLPNIIEVDKIEKISGSWVGYYLRNDKPDEIDSQNEKNGGIQEVTLKIEKNGVLHLNSEHKDDSEKFSGFLSYPILKDNNSKFIKANLGLNRANRIFRLHLFMIVSEDNEQIDGIYSGWNNRGMPFASLISFKRVTFIKELSNLDTRDNHNFISRQEIKIKESLTIDLIESLKNKNHFFSVAETCLPEHLLFNNSIPYGFFSGCYYLLSVDYKVGLLDKAKLLISDDDAFIVEYKDVVYRGVVEFKELSKIGPESYLYLVIKEKGLPNSKEFSEFIGTYLFDIGNHVLSKEEKLYNLVKVLPGVSQRINAAGSPQVKKEFLVSATDSTYFEKRRVEKYIYDEDGFFENIRLNNTSVEQDRILFKNIYNALLGKENNIITVSKKQSNLEESDYRIINYGIVYFKAFLFDLYHSQNKGNLYTNFLEAILSGINKAELDAKFNALFAFLKPSRKNKDEVLQKFEIARGLILTHIKSFPATVLFKLAKKKNHDGTSIFKSIDSLCDSIKQINPG